MGEKVEFEQVKARLITLKEYRTDSRLMVYVKQGVYKPNIINARLYIMKKDAPEIPFGVPNVCVAVTEDRKLVVAFGVCTEEMIEARRLRNARKSLSFDIPGSVVNRIFKHKRFKPGTNVVKVEGIEPITHRGKFVGYIITFGEVEWYGRSRM